MTMKTRITIMATTRTTMAMKSTDSVLLSPPTLTDASNHDVSRKAVRPLESLFFENELWHLSLLVSSPLSLPQRDRDAHHIRVFGFVTSGFLFPWPDARRHARPDVPPDPNQKPFHKTLIMENAVDRRLAQQFGAKLFRSAFSSSRALLGKYITCC